MDGAANLTNIKFVFLVVFNMKFGFFTLGCKVNQYETQAMEQVLRERGHEIGSFDEQCDCYVVNTCSVTAVSDKKSRNIIRRAKKLNPDALIAVCGCYAQAQPEQIRALGVDVIAGTDDRIAFLDMIERAAREHTQLVAIDDPRARTHFELLPAGGLEARTRAMLKVQDGCQNYCTYCIIPYTRGAVRSMPLADAVAEAQKLAQEGYREIVVTGIEVASWGVDLPDKPAPHTLLAALCQAVPEVRIRLGSLEPTVVTEAFCEALSGCANLCPQFHLSLQSGCDRTLKRMNRHYDTARFLQSVALLRETFPGCAITTDLIVGFPGETEEDFAQTLDFLRQCEFAAMHIFPYSRREGTAAVKLPGHLPNSVKEERAARAGAVAAEYNERYRAAMLGQTVEVLFEQPEVGYFAGHAPNYVKCYVRADALHNQTRAVRVTGLFRDGVTGELV
jgi:threonylcarbamoyladenosine tRNA methylthiotransferase MtaB